MNTITRICVVLFLAFGLRILADGEEIGSSKTLGRLTASLPKAADSE